MAKYAQDYERLSEGKTRTETLAAMSAETEQKFPGSNQSWLLYQLATFAENDASLAALVAALAERVTALEGGS